MRLKLIDKNLKFVIFTTKETDEAVKKALYEFKNINFCFNEEEKKKLIQKSMLIIAKSGTNNIEIGSLGTPMIVYYKTSYLTYIFAKIFAKVKFINLFNLTLNKCVIPELVQNQATADNLVNNVVYLVDNNGVRNQQMEQINIAIKMMQRNDGEYPMNIVASEIENLK